jgi:universal stress protein A
VTVGSSRYEIARLAREQHVDFIVIGRHNRHGFGVLLGSTAHGVLNAATCDVMAVMV